MVLGDKTVIESTAIIEEDVEIGDGCYIGHYSIIRSNTKIGNNSDIRAFCFLAGDIRIGNYTKIFQFSNISKGSRIGDNIYIGPRTLMTNTRRIGWRRNYQPKIKAPRVLDGARICSGVILMPGVTVGKDCLIGAGSLVDRDVPDLQIWFGSPARRRGFVPSDETCVEGS